MQTIENDKCIHRYPHKLLQKKKLCGKSPYSEFSGQYFPAFGLNTEMYKVNLRIQSKCGKIRPRKTPNTDTSYVVSKFENYRF